MYYEEINLDKIIDEEETFYILDTI